MGDFKNDMDRFVKTDLTGGFDDSPRGTTPLRRTSKVSKTTQAQSEAERRKRSKASEIAEYRISKMGDEQIETLKQDVIKTRKVTFGLILFILIMCIVALTPLGIWMTTEVEEEGNIFAGILFTLIGVGCMIGMIYHVRKRVKTKDNPVTHGDMVWLVTNRVLSTFTTEVMLDSELERIRREKTQIVATALKYRSEQAETDLTSVSHDAGLALEQAGVDEKALEEQREKEETLCAEVRKALDDQVSAIKKTARKFYNPTAKLVEYISRNILHGEAGWIRLINDAVTVYGLNIEPYYHLRKQIAQDCPNYRFKSSEREYWFNDDYKRIFKTYFDELIKCVREAFPENEHAMISAVYCVVRINIIKYYASAYKQNSNADTLEEYCSVTGSIADSSVAWNISNLFGFVCRSMTDDLFSEKCIFKAYIQVKLEVAEIVNRQKDEAARLALFDGKPMGAKPQTASSSATESRASLEETIDHMSGYEFEQFLARLFEKKGYTARVTRGSGDYGIDVIIENGIVKIGIQAKCYNSGNVGNDAVQQALSGCLYYGLDKAMVITNSYFTAAAIQQAKSSKVTLWNRDQLLKECRENGIKE